MLHDLSVQVQDALLDEYMSRDKARWEISAWWWWWYNQKKTK